ncbi:MAG: uroporphyrinogen-III synthase [Burkholderiales bacterium]|nr:uroporphyrinogen-III synthase [Burkholderiales bacterium]
MAKPVVITRPLAQAAPLAEQVSAVGRAPIIFPLLEIQPLPDAAFLRATLDTLHRFALIAFVSPNAIDAAFAVRPDWPRDIPIAIIGEGSRKALAAHGITDANAIILSSRDPARTDSQTLLVALDKDALQGREVLIVRGETGRELLADELRAAGIAVTQVAAYRRSAPRLDASTRAQLLQLIDTENDWIVTSSEAMRNLLQMAEQVAGESAVAKMQQQRFLVPHARIAETAHSLNFRNVTLTGSGDERLLAALQSRP